MKWYRFRLTKIIVIVAIGILAFEAVSTMLFGSLGTTAESDNWNFMVLLYCFLAVIGVTTAIAKIKSKLKILKMFSSIAAILSVGLGFALLGFYYGGNISDRNSAIAAITAIILGTLGTILGWKKNQIALAASTTIATVAAYGFAFYASTNAVAYFSVSQFMGGIFWSLICLIYIGLTLSNFTNTIMQLPKT